MATKVPKLDIEFVKKSGSEFMSNLYGNYNQKFEYWKVKDIVGETTSKPQEADLSMWKYNVENRPELKE